MTTSDKREGLATFAHSTVSRAILQAVTETGGQLVDRPVSDRHPDWGTLKDASPADGLVAARAIESRAAGRVREYLSACRADGTTWRKIGELLNLQDEAKARDVLVADLAFEIAAGPEDPDYRWRDRSFTWKCRDCREYIYHHGPAGIPRARRWRPPRRLQVTGCRPPCLHQLLQGAWLVTTTIADPIPGWIARVVLVTAQDDAVLTALEGLWAKIRHEEASVPAAVFEIGPGRESSCTSVGWDQRYPILQINLMRGGRKVTSAELLQTLLHLAAHAATYEPGTLGPSENRYHSRAYRDVADSIGLTATAVPGDGWATTELARGTLTRYRPRWPPGPGAGEVGADSSGQGHRDSRNPVPFVCSCDPPRRLRMNQGQADLGVVICSICGEPFRAG